MVQVSIFINWIFQVRITNFDLDVYGISRDRSIQLLDVETGNSIRVRETTHE